MKRLELQGFKSFADKTVLDFMPGITTVIGPNGSGKSNISDAIRWVLGEQSMKSLRGSKTEDVIFAGTQARKSLGFAEVSIIFDNQDGKLPIEFSEVTVTRRIYRSGESGYFINKTPCRLKDILELLMDTGIGKDGYSIIGQGKIDEILSNKSEERRHIFEEAAGIVKYRTRKVESEKKLEQTKLNLLRINDILSEIESNIEPLKIQSEKAKKFLDLREELKSIEIGLFIHNIEQYKLKIDEIIKEEDIFSTQSVREEERLSNIQEQKENLKKAIDDITTKIEEMQALSFESEKKKEQFNSEIQINQERIVNNKENYDRFAVEIEESKKMIEELEEEKNQKESKKSNLFENKKKFADELEEKEKQLKEITEKLSNEEIEIEGKKQQVDKNIDDKFEMGNTISTLVANIENADKRIVAINQEISNYVSELDSSRIKKSEIDSGFYEIEAKRNQIKNNLLEIDEKRKNYEAKLKGFVDNINNIESQIRFKDSRLHFLEETEKEKEGYVRSVKAILTDCEKNISLKKGVHGVLANLISVPKEYETAIEMTLGQAMQNIVTDTEQDAKKLVEHLRVNKLGRASFLPISSVKGKKLDKISKTGGVIGIASDLIKYDKKYDGIVQNLLGRTVIVDTMDNAIFLAKQFKYSFKIVTLEGDVINPSGMISGGSVAQKTVNILGRSREIEDLKKEIKNLKAKLEKTIKEKEDYETEMEDTIELVASFEKEMQDSEIVYATEKQKVISIENEISKIEERLERVKKEKEDLESQKKDNLKIQDDLKERIKEIETQNEELNKEITEFAVRNKDKQKDIDDLNFDITNLKISVSSFDESEVSIKEMIERIDSDIEKTNVVIENKTKQREKILEDNKALEEKIEELKLEIEKLKDDVENGNTKVTDLKEERVNKNKKLEETEEEITSQIEKIDGLKDQISKCEVRKSKNEYELEQVITKMWEEYEITPLDPGEYTKPENVKEVEKKVSSIRGEIKELGSINIDAIEEYKQLKERYDFMSEQRLDLENTVAKLKKVITEMVDIMKDQFDKKFKTINKYFGEVFVQLFGGGKAELKLTDEANILESGIEIEVQPPGKKLQNMSLLSGGERAFTAIALLFAILKINPAPFCVLDEIEAALDDVNVYRFADYLKKYTDSTQFLVITHRKGTMEAANTVYGITMEENGISKLLSLSLK
ncbi:MAG: chromosome segregation protein SMC [Clostridia bacterium]|nr:chromosome segregation protein SMC [Clostridia bacterium]MBR3152256.1 chromosome segregation protein SMC [Clostridia bacterium]